MKKIPLTQGQEAKVSDHCFDYYSQWKWQAHYDPKMQSYYAVRSDYSGGKQKTIWMHCDIMKTPKGMMCDHKDHDTLNNQDDNLRNCTNSQNQWNGKIRIDNKSGYKGVSYHKSTKKWIAQLQKDGNRALFKRYQTAELAAHAYDEKARELFGEFAVLNFPESLP